MRPFAILFSKFAKIVAEQLVWGSIVEWGELLTAEESFDLLLMIEDRLDVLIVKLDEYLREDLEEKTYETGADIFDLLRQRVDIKNFIKNEQRLDRIITLGQYD